MDNPAPLEAVNKVQNYIEDNLYKRMTLHELANVAGYSPWHLSKLFKKYCGKTIFDYIRALRLSQAALFLRDNETTVVEVALDFIFDTHEGFTRAFAKEFGITPKKYAQTTPPIKLFIPNLANDWENKKRGNNKMSENSSVIFTQVIERSKRKAIIKRGIKATHYFEYCEEVGCDVWGELCSIKGALYEPMGMWLPIKLIAPGTSLYVQGVEVPEDFAGTIPEGYDLIDLAPCKMMIFQGQKYDDNNFEYEVGKVMKAIDNYDPEPFGFVWAPKEAPRFQYEPLGSRGYIEGRPVKQIAK
jgi:AraC family transcriptional regulator